nr:MAG TPA: hypothetical protein [Bacteriophage sp.]
MKIRCISKPGKLDTPDWFNGGNCAATFKGENCGTRRVFCPSA